MSQYLEGAVKTDTAAGAIGAHLRVKTPGALEVAGVSDFCIGTMEFPCLAAGPASYRVRTAQGTRKVVAAGAINRGVTVYAAADGKVSASAGSGVVEGVSLQAAGANNDVIEIMMSTTSGAAANDAATTTASSFTIASGSSDAKLALDVDSKTGNHTLTLAPADNLAGARKIQIPVTNCTLLGDTLPVVVTTNEANSLAIGRQGATSPALLVVGGVANSATGVSITPTQNTGVTIAALGGTNENMTIAAKGTGTITIGSGTNASLALAKDTAVAGKVTVTTNEASAMAVGRAGATNPALLIVGGVADSATGVSVTPAAAASGVTIAAISSEANESMTVTAKGTGTVTIGAGTNAGITLAKPVAVADNVTMTDAKNIVINTGTGTKIGTGATQKIGFWNAPPVVQPTLIANTNTDTTELQNTVNAVLALLKATGLMASA